MNWIQLTSVGFFIQQQQTTHSSQAYMEHPPRETHSGPKASLDKLKSLEIIHSILADCDGIKLEISNRKIARKSQDTWR